MRVRGGEADLSHAGSKFTVTAVNTMLLRHELYEGHFHLKITSNRYELNTGFWNHLKAASWLTMAARLMSLVARVQDGIRKKHHRNDR